jgi:hypothetical protein
MDFENSRLLYRQACNLSNRIYSTGHFIGIEIILLAFPTYITSNLSACPMTSLDGDDLVDNELAELTQIHRINDRNTNETIYKWKSPLFSTRIREIIPLTQESIDYLLINGFSRKEKSYFSFLNDHIIFKSE